VRRIRADLTDSPGVTRAATLATMADRMRGRGFIDDLAALPHDTLTELDQLIADLEPLAAALAAAGSE